MTSFVEWITLCADAHYERTGRRMGQLALSADEYSDLRRELIKSLPMEAERDDQGMPTGRVLPPPDLTYTSEIVIKTQRCVVKVMRAMRQRPRVYEWLEEAG